MLRVAYKGVMARKLRLLLTSIAVVLGVGFVAGAYFLTDSLRSSFDNIFEQASVGIDVQVTTKAYKELAAQQATNGGGPSLVAIDYEQVGVPASVVKQLRDVPGVQRTAGSIFVTGAQPIDRQGKPISTGGAPTFASNWVEEARDIGALRIVEGDAPERDQVVLDATTMKRGRFDVGDDVTVLLDGGRVSEEFEISGVLKFGDSNSLNGASITAFQTAQLQELLEMGDRFSAVDVQAKSGTSPEQLKLAIKRELGPKYDVITGAELTQEQTEQIDDAFLGIVQNVILGFAAIAVFVGAFTIFNTFTILVGQRTREIGLLRAIGASRGQVLGIVVLEAIVVGIVASTLGIAAGYGIAAILRALINGFADGSIPTEPFPLHTRTVVASYLVGVLVTLVASLLPAWRAARLSPLEALRSNSAHAGRGWKVPAAGAVLMLVGAGFVSSGFSAGEGSTVSSVLARIGGGFAVAIIGIALLSRLFILPVTRVLAPVLARGTTGELASRNVLRNRARSATTASALMIGLALASLALVFQSSLKETFSAEIDRTLGADITAYNSSMMNTGTGVVRQADLDRIAGVDGVDEVAAQRYGGATIGTEFNGDDAKIVTALDDGALGSDGLVRVEMTDGAQEPGSGVLVDTDLASKEGLEVGDTLTLAFSTGERRDLTVKGLYEPNQFLGAPIVLSVATFDEVQPPAVQAPAFLYVSVDDGQSPREVVHRITKELGKSGAYIEVRDTAQLRELLDQQIAPVLGMVLAMLALSLVIALFGIGNTLALNVFERTREIGLLRAVGSTRRQVRRLIRVEAVLVAVFGAIVGVLVGVAAGRALVAALADDGFVFRLSVMPLVFVLLGGFLAGVVASLLPARRAARTNVLDAIATE